MSVWSKQESLFVGLFHLMLRYLGLKMEHYQHIGFIKKRKNMENTDRVNHPSHYTWLKKLCGIEVIDITRHMNFNLGNCIKYVLRAGHKSEEGYTEKDKTIEDLEKAIFYIKDEIERIKNDKEGV